MKKIAILLILIALSQACTQTSHSCFKKLGKIDTLSVNLSYFKSLKNNLICDIKLFNDNKNYVRIIGREMLLPKISIEQIEDTVILKDRNICYFMHNYDSSRICVEIHTTGDTLIVYNKNAATISSDNIKLALFIFTSSTYLTNLDLNITSDIISIGTWHGTGNYKLRGTTDLLSISSYNSAWINADSLLAHKANIMNNSVCDIKVNVSDYLNAVIKNSGNIFYRGKPRIDSVITGSGKLIKIQ